MQQVTMAQIAERLGVDQSTVSLSLRNSPRISASTRERVQKAAAEMGYRANPFVAALMRTRKKRSVQQDGTVVAWVSAWLEPETWMQVPTFKTYFEGAEERLREHGFRLEHFWLNRHSLSPTRLSSILWSRGISGIIVAPVPNENCDVSLEWERFSSVTIGRSVHSPQLDRVDSAHFDAISTAILRCHELGYKRIGLALEKKQMIRFEYRWLASYLVNCPTSDYVEPFSENIRSDQGFKAFRSWFKRNTPEVIITLSRLDGENLREAFEKMKLKVPADAGIVILSCHSLDDPYSGIYQFPKLMGAQAAEILIRKMLFNEKGLPKNPLTLSINGTWNVGTTVKRGAQSPSECEVNSADLPKHILKACVSIINRV